MPGYDVHFYMTFRAKIPNVEAESQVAAIQKAFETFEPDKHVKVVPAPGSPAVAVEYEDEINGALIDEVGDDDYSETCAYDLKAGEWVLKKIDMVTPLL